MLTDAQLELRMTGVGASEVAAIVGMNEYEDAHSVWLRKIGEGDPFEMNRYVEWGNRLEGEVARAYQENYLDRLNALAPVGSHDFVYLLQPWEIEESPAYEKLDGGTLRSVEHPCVLVTPDRIWSRAVRGRRRGLEVKTTTQYSGKKWGEPWMGGGQGDLYPHGYYLQTQYQLHLLRHIGVEQMDLTVLIGGSDHRVLTIDRDERVGEWLVDEVCRFWRDYVEARREPPRRELEKFVSPDVGLDARVDSWLSEFR